MLSAALSLTLRQATVRLVTVLYVLTWAAWARPAAADTVGLHLVSVHAPAYDYNNGNLGAYYKLDSGWTAGFFRNSINRDSTYAGYTMSWFIFDITAGVITGYRDSVDPLIIPTVRLPITKDFRARVAYIPPVDRIDAHVLHLMAEFDF